MVNFFNFLLVRTNKKQEPVQASPPKAPLVMKRKEEVKPKPRVIVSELTYKEIIQTQATENYKYLFNNAAIVKLMREYSNLYADSLEKKYNKVLKETIREKVLSIETEINAMKQIFEKMKNTKFNNDEFKFDSSSSSVTGNESNEFKNIFDLRKNSIKAIKEKIKALPQNKTQSLRFNLEYSDFYLNVDVDKSFEIFKENIVSKTISSDLKAVVEDYIGNFLLRIYELDRLIYVSKLFIMLPLFFHLDVL